MVSVKEIYNFLDQKAPFAYQLGFDNAGFLVGREDAVVSGILVALDLTEAVLQEAIAQNVQLVLTHHPLIWDKRAAVTDQDPVGRLLLDLIEHKIALIAAHTNLDAVEGGVNSTLAAILQLEDTQPLSQDGVDEQGTPYGSGRVGQRREACTLATFAQEVKHSLHLEGLRFMDAGRPVRRVAVGGGACGGMLSDVLRHGCDTFVTSELKHDVYLDARAKGINLIDAGHYGTETVICPVLVDWLRQAFPAIHVSLSAAQREAFAYA